MFRVEDRWMNGLAWIHTLLLFSGFYLLAAAVCGCSEQQGFLYLAKALWLLVPVSVSWFGVRQIRHFLAYFLGAVLVTVFAGVLSRDILTMVCSVFIFLIRCYPRISRGKRRQEEYGNVEEKQFWEIPTILDQPKIQHWLIFIFLYLLIIFIRGAYLLNVLFALLLLEIFICYAFYSILRLKQFVLSRRRIANLPIKTMQRMQRAILVITTCLLVLFVLPSLIYGKEPLVALTRLKMAMNIEISLPETGQNMDIPQENNMQEILDAIAQEETFQIPEWVEDLLEIIFYGLLAAAAIVAAVLLYQAFRNMMKSFEAGKEEDEVILLDEDASRGIGLRRRSFQKREDSPDWRIRKAYKRTIRTLFGVRPDGWESPSELEERAGLQGTDRYHEIYEKARYSHENCCKEEAEEFLQIQKKWKKRQKDK